METKFHGQKENMSKFVSFVFSSFFFKQIRKGKI